MNTRESLLVDRQSRIAVQTALDRVSLVAIGGYGQPTPVCRVPVVRHALLFGDSRASVPT